MKYLTLIRHAKSSWKHDVPDDLRPLKNRGLEDSKAVSNYLKDKIFLPDLILSSHASRAKTTAKIFIEILHFYEVDYQLNKNLYDFSGANLLKEVQNSNADVNSLMIFGHNHAITSFINTYGSIFIENVPTCGVVQIKFNIEDWKDLNKGETILTVFPRDLR